MNRATLILVAAALVSIGGAYTMRPKPLPPAAYEDTGEALFKDFTDPTLATFLEVVTWDEESAEVIRFSVEQKEGRWVIPSHNDYPADGTEKMGKAAASFIDVKKDLYYGDNAADHAKFGVLDPDGAEGKGDERGKRITIKDAAGSLLVDVIVGKDVENKQGLKYVRYPGEKRVYASKLELQISTTFSDWIEKDLLRVERDEIVQVVYDPYKVDEGEGKVLGRDPIVANLAQGDKTDEWEVDAATKLPEGKVLDQMKIKQIATAVANVKIVGVRPRPELTEMPVQVAVGVLQPKGFFVSMGQEGPQLFGNEGQVSVVTKDGIVYTLLFGEVTYESGLALTAGSEDGKAPEEKKEEEKKEGEEGEEAKPANRYMFVNVHYDPSRDKGSAIEEEPEPELPEGEEGEDKKDEPPKPKGPQRAEQLSKRFGSWFYVISDTSFKQIHKERDEMFKDAPKEEKKDEEKPDEGADEPFPE